MKRLPFTFRYTTAYAARRGKQDGQADPPIPTFDCADQPPYINELTEAGSGTLQSISQDWQKKDRKLHPNWVSRQDAANVAKLTLTEAEAALVQAETAYEQTHSKKPPATDRRFSLYWLCQAILTVIECPLNAVVFRVFGESEVLTDCLALGLGFVLVLLAHFWGVVLAARKFLAAFVLAVVPLLVIGGVAWYRAQYLTTRPDATIRLDLTPTLLTFFAFNLAVWVVAAVYSLLVHDEELRRVFLCRKSLTQARRNHTRFVHRLDAAISQRMKVHTHFYAAAANIICSVNRLAEVYRGANLQARSDRAGSRTHFNPASYSWNPHVSMPAELEQLVWEEGVPSLIARRDIPAFTALPNQAISNHTTSRPPAVNTPRTIMGGHSEKPLTPDPARNGSLSHHEEGAIS